MKRICASSWTITKNHCMTHGQKNVKVFSRSQGVGLRPFACWDCGFESHPGHGCLSVVSVVCCQLEVSATNWSLVKRSSADCGASLCVVKKPRKRGGYSPLRGCKNTATMGCNVRKTNKHTNNINSRYGIHPAVLPWIKNLCYVRLSKCGLWTAQMYGLIKLRPCLIKITLCWIQTQTDCKDFNTLILTHSLP